MSITNNTIAEVIKESLEKIGHQNVNVWFEEPDDENDYDGGWVFTSSTIVNGVEHNYFDVLGTDINDISLNIENYRIVK